MIKKSRRRYDDEFKARAVKMVVDGKRTAADVARELNIGYISVLAWLKKYKASQGNSNHKCNCLNMLQHDRVRHLEDELLIVKAERDVYKNILQSGALISKPQQLRLL